VVDVVEVDAREIGAPLRHRPGQEVVERLVPVGSHPVGLALAIRDLVDDLVAEATLGLLDVVGGIAPPVLVALLELTNCLVLSKDRVLCLCSHSEEPSCGRHPYGQSGLATLSPRLSFGPARRG